MPPLLGSLVVSAVKILSLESVNAWKNNKKLRAKTSLYLWLPDKVALYFCYKKTSICIWGYFIDIILSWWCCFLVIQHYVITWYRDAIKGSFILCQRIFIACQRYLGSHEVACWGGSDVQYRSSQHQKCVSPFCLPCSPSQRPTGLNEKNLISASPARLWSDHQKEETGNSLLITV